MRIAFNALSVSNMSGRHVLLGHMRQIVAATAGEDRHLLLHHAGNRDLCESLAGQVDMFECPPITTRWVGRWVWERWLMPVLLRRCGATMLFSPAGVTTPGVSIPQISLAQNPWCFATESHKGPTDSLKAFLQKAAYRRAQRTAALMLFNSGYMAQVYRTNAGHDPVQALLLYQGLDDETFEAASTGPSFGERRCEILVVSAMARHKSIEDIVDAMVLLRQRGVPARMKLVGPWPDGAYRTFIQRRVESAGLTAEVDFIGYVTREQLHRHYGEARVFCLLSRCESFGIPAIEAEAFGTPAVVADRAAPPEIAGPGGVVVPPGDASAAADALECLLTDALRWEAASTRARTNASRFRWQQCSRPLLDWIRDREGA